MDLGLAVEDGSPVFVHEAERIGIDIIGASRQGKSKLVEIFLRHDINSGYGACFMDSSDNGETMYAVLRYAIYVGYKNVVIIDPYDIADTTHYGFTPCINPVRFKAPAYAVSADIKETLRVLWGEDFQKTGNIQRYLPSVITALHSAGATLSDADCFVDIKNPDLKDKRDQILTHLLALSYRFREYQTDYGDLLSVFGHGKVKPTPREFDMLYMGTRNRLEAFTHPILRRLFGSRCWEKDGDKWEFSHGLNFQTLVAKKYLILVNLAATGLYTAAEQQLLGTLILGEVLSAVDRLRHPRPDREPWQGRFHLYIDEAQKYPTARVKTILDEKPKTGISLALAHHAFDQFPPDIEASIRRNTAVKIMFNPRDDQDIRKMVNLMYGGSIDKKEVEYYVMNLRKQHAVFHSGTQPPVAFRVDDVEDVPVTPEEVYQFKINQYKTRSFYARVDEVEEEINNRFALHPSARKQAHTQGGADKAHSKKVEPAPNDNPATTTGDKSAEPSKQATTTNPRRSPIFDNDPDSKLVLPDKSRRSTRKRTDNPPPSK